jgi:hypothetical protein
VIRIVKVIPQIVRILGRCLVGQLAKPVHLVEQLAVAGNADECESLRSPGVRMNMRNV